MVSYAPTSWLGWEFALELEPELELAPESELEAPVSELDVLLYPLPPVELSPVWVPPVSLPPWVPVEPPVWVSPPDCDPVVPPVWVLPPGGVLPPV